MPRLHRFAPLLLAGASLVGLAFLPRTGKTVPLYAARTGLACQSCHFDPNGGGPRNEFGFAYAKNRHSLEPDTKEEWKDLALRNRVSDDFPLYFGLNQRFMLLANKQLGDATIEHIGFWNMENALYTTFQPHPRLTLSYNAEATSGPNFQSRDAFALIGLGANHYLKAGQFRVPFGLRLDDHTVATRNSFLDYQTGARFLPYDPRNVDRGIELGGTHGNLFARGSFTNGAAQAGNGPPVNSKHPQAVAAKVGYSRGSVQGAASVYDDWAPGNAAGQSARRSRWGGYTLASRGPVALLGELAFGTDQFWAAGRVSRTNMLAGFVEADWAPHRAYNVRFRYDRLELNNSTDESVDAANSWNRFALEGEWVPVPFAELRWTMRLIDPVQEHTPAGVAIESEKQAYLQLHVSY